MRAYLPAVAVLGLCVGSSVANPGTPPPGLLLGPDDGARAFTVESRNLYRVKSLLGGDVRAVWIGDSWSIANNTTRLPYGSLLVWPIGELRAICLGWRPGSLQSGTDFTNGPGALVEIDAGVGWQTDLDSANGWSYFALPVNNMTRVFGDASLTLDQSWPGLPRVQSLRVQNTQIDAGDLGLFTEPGDHVRCRVLYYAPRAPENLASSIVLADADGTPLGSFAPGADARAFRHTGGDPDDGVGHAPALAQVNALVPDVALGANLFQGPELTVCEDAASPLVGSARYWLFAGGVYYLTDETGARLPGYYHGGLATESWSYKNFATDAPSKGSKQFSDEQLRHWLDVTTLDRDQRPIFILHMATEQKSAQDMEGYVRTIVNRLRLACSAIGTRSPRFLLVGSYMSRIDLISQPTDRDFVEHLNLAMANVATTEPDCAFFSLYAATDGTFFASDTYSGPGGQQAARDWLDANGWSTITYGGSTYNLSSASNNGLNGRLISDGLHIGTSPAAAFFARLVGDAIEAEPCPADADDDGGIDTRDVVVFLNTWVARDPSADLDGDGDVDTADFIRFLNIWNEGC